MTELAMGMQQWQLQFQGVSIVSASLRKALAGNAKKDGMFAQCWYCIISIAKFWVLDYKFVL